jgi:hypothetical protein
MVVVSSHGGPAHRRGCDPLQQEPASDGKARGAVGLFATIASMNRRVVGLAIIFIGCAAPPRPAVAPPETRAASASSSPVPAPAVASQSTTSANTTTDPEPDQAPCHGSIDESLQHELAGRAAQVRSCYENLLRREPRREGRLVVTVKLSEPGTIEHAWITLDELADPETTQCALAFFKAPLEGKIVGNCAIVNVPLRFKIKKPEPASSPENPRATKG